jgi:hypothetical protein
MLFELANSLRSLTSPLTSALHTARRMARPLHFEEGGTVPTHGAAGGQQDRNAFPLPPDIREEEVASAIRDWLQAKRFSAPKRNIDAVSPLKTSSTTSTRCNAYSFVATVENVAVRLVPTVPSTVTAATAIRAAIRPYSIAVAPSSFFKSFVKVANIRISIGR